MSGGIIGMFFYLILFISIPIAYSLLKKNGKPILAKIVATLIILLILTLILSNKIESNLYFKYDARQDLKLAHLILKDDFEIINNYVVGMPERFQYTKLKISNNDRNRIISEIKNGKYYNNSKDCRNTFIYSVSSKKIKNKIMYTNYSSQNEILRESYYQKDENVPITVIVIVTNKSNFLDLTRIEE